MNQVFAWLGRRLRKGPGLELTFQAGQNDHHLASESLYLPWFGWKSRFCFPLRMACLHPPSSSDVGSSKGGQTITLGRKPVYSSKDFAQKKTFFLNKRHICYCGWLFGQKVIVRCPPRCLVSSWKPAPRWSGGSTQAGTRMIRD